MNYLYAVESKRLLPFSFFFDRGNVAKLYQKNMSAQ